MTWMCQTTQQKIVDYERRKQVLANDDAPAVQDPVWRELKRYKGPLTHELLKLTCPDNTSIS